MLLCHSWVLNPASPDKCASRSFCTSYPIISYVTTILPQIVKTNNFSFHTAEKKTQIFSSAQRIWSESAKLEMKLLGGTTVQVNWMDNKPLATATRDAAIYSMDY
ncbi:hypothetical protein CHARACLAT_020440 [Characodon lateralis]|uniref:Uncharacterized protein n=1 Tax=Characodon lateralis TaxID=208331 RepID=A0ABU7CPQ7_9TELE|nr:hypothetical protein [Characodon lateralis]